MDELQQWPLSPISPIMNPDLYPQQSLNYQYLMKRPSVILAEQIEVSGVAHKTLFVGNGVTWR